MKTQKQSRLDALEKRVAAMTNVIQQLIQESTNLRTLSFGTLETMKQMPDYDEALEKLKEKTTEKNNEKKLEI
jgi:uncharacterized coiled-coil protein SlyX